MVCGAITLFLLSFSYLFADILSHTTKKAFQNQTVPREFILSYIFVIISAVQMLKIMEKLQNKGEGLQ